METFCGNPCFGSGVYAQTPLPPSFVPEFQKIKQLPGRNVANGRHLVCGCRTVLLKKTTFSDWKKKLGSHIVNLFWQVKTCTKIQSLYFMIYLGQFHIKINNCTIQNSKNITIVVDHIAPIPMLE